MRIQLLRQDCIILDNNIKGLCLISAFFQEIYLQNREENLTGKLLLEKITEAMTFVSTNNIHFTDLSYISFAIISTWNDGLIKSIAKGIEGLKRDQYWNIEMLELYISLAKYKKEKIV